jgi:tetratricopeptide (TPR) repeat protein
VARAVAGLRAAADDRARQAELERVRAEGERAKAEAGAREQRKRRQAQLALAAAVGLLLLGASLFGWHADRQAADRQRDERARLERNAEAVAALLDECEDALRADRADQAAVALGAAHRRAADGGVDELAGRLAACRADLGLLRALNDADTLRWTERGEAPADQRAFTARCREALADYGVRVDETPADKAAGRVDGSLVRDRILAALDQWLAVHPSAGVRAVLRAADPDPYRESVRDAVAARDARALVALAGQPAALAQPARFAAVLGQRAAVPPDRRRAVLEGALLARPGDLSLLMALGNSHPNVMHQGAGERVRWFQAAVAAHPGNLAARVNLGEALRASGDGHGAIVTLNEVLRLDPTFARAHVALGEAVSDRVEAVARIKEGIRLAPNYAYAHLALGRALQAGGDRDGAIASYKEAVRLSPTFTVAHYELGQTLRATGDLPGAIASFREAARITPKFPAAHYELGETLRAKGDLAGAVAAYREAVRLDPDDTRIRYTLADALFDMGDFDAAVAAHRDAIQLDSSLSYNPAARGKDNLPTSGPQRAVTRFKEAVRRHPKDARAHYGLGFALGKQGDRAGSTASFREVVRLDPNFAPGHLALADTLRVAGDQAGALASYREAVRLRPDFAAAQLGLGKALADGRDWAGAIAAHEAAVRLNPESAAAHSSLGDARRAAGDRAGAAASYQEAVRLRPDDARGHLVLGNARRALGDLTGAIAAYREAIRLHPNLVGAHIGLGLALMRTGDAVGASAAFAEVVRLDPTEARCHNQLAWLLATGPGGIRNGARAVTHATQACELSGWKTPTYIDTLAAAHAEIGDFDRALEFEQRALASPAFEKADGKGGRERLALYQQQKKYRDPGLMPREAGPPPREVTPNRSHQ